MTLYNINYIGNFHLLDSFSPNISNWKVLVKNVSEKSVINQCIANVVKLRQGSGKDWQGVALKAKGLKA